MPAQPVENRPTIDAERLARQFYGDLDDNGRRGLAEILGVSSESLDRLRAGWSFRHRAYSFPMRNSTNSVIGIRLRTYEGKKFAVKGSRAGLFIPAGIVVGERLFVCEGPTDTAAGVDLGVAIVGRPSCNGGVRLIVELVQDRKPREVVIVGDDDQPGRDGAERLAKALLDRTQAGVRIVLPPDDIKDLRAWKAAGATPEDVEAAVEAAKLRWPMPIGVRLANRHAVEHRVKVKMRTRR